MGHCIWKWIELQQLQDRHAVCPLCRKPWVIKINLAQNTFLSDDNKESKDSDDEDTEQKQDIEQNRNDEDSKDSNDIDAVPVNTLIDDNNIEQFPIHMPSLDNMPALEYFTDDNANSDNANNDNDDRNPSQIVQQMLQQFFGNTDVD